jgi:hypothetical protein
MTARIASRAWFIVKACRWLATANDAKYCRTIWIESRGDACYIPYLFNLFLKPYSSEKYNDCKDCKAGLVHSQGVSLASDGKRRQILQDDLDRIQMRCMPLFPHLVILFLKPYSSEKYNDCKDCKAGLVQNRGAGFAVLNTTIGIYQPRVVHPRRAPAGSEFRERDPGRVSGAPCQ